MSSPNLKTLTICLSFILCIYLLRSTPQLLPTRLLDQQKLIAKFCDGISQNNTYSLSQHEKADGYRNSIENIRPDDKTLTYLIHNNQPSDGFLADYGKGILPILAPWLCFFVIGAVGCVVFLIHWCCMNCSCCKRCAFKRNRSTEPAKTAAKTSKRNNFFVIASVLFMLMTVGAGIAGLVFSTKIPKQAYGTICWTARLMEKINEGSPEDNWIGLNPAIISLDNINSDIGAAVNRLNVFNAILANLTTNTKETTKLITATYTKSKDVTVARINPDASTYKPDYISKLGPPSDSSTSTGLMQAEVEFKKTFISNVQPVLAQNTAIIQSQAQQVIRGIQAVRNIISQVSNTNDNISSDVQGNQDTISKMIYGISSVLLGLFIANVVLGVFALFSITLISRGMKAFNKGVHASWCTLGFFMLVGWLVTTAIFAVTVVVSESCDVGNGITKDPVFFNKTFAYIDTVFDIEESDYNRTRDVLYTCFHGDGDLAKQLNLSSNVADFNQIFATVDQFSTLASNTIGSLPASAATPVFRSYLNQIKAGTIPDSIQYTAADLLLLNGLTRKDTNPCTSVNDAWVLNSQTCTSSLGTTFTSTSSATYNLNSKTCIGENIWTATGNNIDSRYTSSQFPELGCPPIGGQAMYRYVQRYVRSLAKNRAQTDTAVNKILQDLDQIDVLNNEFKAGTQTVPTEIQSLNAIVVSLFTELTAPNGIINTVNCQFVRTDFEILLDNACTGFGGNMYQIMIVYLVLSFATLAGVSMLFLLAKRSAAGAKIQKKKSIIGLQKIHLDVEKN